MEPGSAPAGTDPASAPFYLIAPQRAPCTHVAGSTALLTGIRNQALRPAPSAACLFPTER